MAMEEETPLLSKTEESNPKKPPSPWFIIAPIFGLTFCFG
jgi:hypothetical protein